MKSPKKYRGEGQKGAGAPFLYRTGNNCGEGKQVKRMGKLCAAALLACLLLLAGCAGQGKAGTPTQAESETPMKYSY